MCKLPKSSPVWLAALAVFGLVSTASAQTLVCGNISGTWPPSGNPYIATCDCTIPAGQTLTLQPGVVFLIGSNVTIGVNGTIAAVGIPTNRIAIRAASSTYTFNSIYFYNPSGTNLFTYCDFNSAQTAINMQVHGDSQFQTMFIDILNCTFSNCVSQAIYGESYGGNNGSSLVPTIENCTFSTSSNGCVIDLSAEAINYYPYGSASPNVIANIFQNLTGTAFLMTVANYAVGSTPLFINNTIVNCHGGISAVDPWDAQVQDNIFAGCTNAVMDSGSLSRQVSYNDFYGNATNFTGYPGTYGQIIWANRNGTPADILYNIYSNPLFVATNDFHLTTNSPCVNAGTPGATYANMCFPPSVATNFPDLGAYGGPDACNWLDVVPMLPVELSLTQSNNQLG